MSDHAPEFYRAPDATVEASARRIVPLLLGLVSVRSVVDVGCGDGGWLTAFSAHGIEDVLDLDGPWVEEALLKIPRTRCRQVRLDSPLDLDRRFDLVASLEAAEHLPEGRAQAFVADLARLSPVVLFAAAVPGQGGVHHINEQWPGYWARLFAGYGFRAADVLRARLWNEADVAYWYKQNLLLFASQEALDRTPRLAAAAAGSPEEPLPLIHPELFALVARLARPRMGRWLKMAPEVMRRTLRPKPPRG